MFSQFRSWIPISWFKADFVLGCDGAYSVVRREILRNSPINFSQIYAEQGYKELYIPQNESSKPKWETESLKQSQLAPEFFHIWPRKEFMLTALPNKVSEISTLTLNLSGWVFFGESVLSIQGAV